MYAQVFSDNYQVCPQTNLLNNDDQIVEVDLLTGEATCISSNLDGTSSGVSYNPVYSNNGNHIVFASGADNLVEEAYEAVFNLFVFSRSPANPTCNGLEATIVGTPGNDTLWGTEGSDVIVGLSGNDSIDGLGGDDTICGNQGNDTIKGRKGNDYISGGKGNDTLFGNNGTDTLRGKKGNDSLIGGSQDDDLNVSDGNDTCVGGRGSDSAENCEHSQEVEIVF